MLIGLHRLLYTLIAAFAVPFAFVRLAWRSRREPGYRAHLSERLGFGPALPAVPRIWIHAVSVGETRAALPLVRRINAEIPEARVLLTHTTPAGRATGRELFGSSVDQAWLPYDIPCANRRFLERTRPGLCLLLETEIWPNLLAATRAAGIPAWLVNARLSERSARGYSRAATLTRGALNDLAGIVCQTPAHADRFRRLGAARVSVAGNLKFDFPVPADTAPRAEALRERWGHDRLVWVFGSSREGEEEEILAVLDTAGLPSQSLLVLVPRHPQRFDEVAGLLSARGIDHVRRSSPDPVLPGTRVVLGDSMGEMLAYYASAEAVLMGGTLLEYGGQNLIEVMAVGRPVILGPHTFNFADVASAAVEAGAAVRVDDARAALRAVARLLGDGDRAARMGAAGREFTECHRGALERIWAELPLEQIRTGRSRPGGA